MAYAIMRCEKIKNMGRLGGSFLHAFRERKTLNADPSRTASNVDYFARNEEEAMTRAKLTLPEKIRKNGVIAVEYLFTASPEWFKTATSEQKKDFFDRSVDWLAKKYGREHIITATVHNDETTPHLTAVVIPIDSKGKLNARGFIGGVEKLRADQDSYAAAVSSLGLVRGIRGSKAHHQDIQDWYGQINRQAKELKKDLITPEELQPKKLSWLWSEAPDAVADRINKRLKPILERARVTDLVSEDASKTYKNLNELRYNYQVLQCKYENLLSENRKQYNELEQAKMFLQRLKTFVAETFGIDKFKSLFVNWEQRQEAERQRQEAERQRQEAERQRQEVQKRKESNNRHRGFSR